MHFLFAIHLFMKILCVRLSSTAEADAGHKKTTHYGIRTFLKIELLFCCWFCVKTFKFSKPSRLPAWQHIYISACLAT